MKLIRIGLYVEERPIPLANRFGSTEKGVRVRLIERRMDGQWITWRLIR
jgi:hypothetical protein